MHPSSGSSLSGGIRASTVLTLYVRNCAHGKSLCTKNLPMGFTRKAYQFDLGRGILRGTMLQCVSINFLLLTPGPENPGENSRNCEKVNYFFNSTIGARKNENSKMTFQLFFFNLTVGSATAALK